MEKNKNNTWAIFFCSATILLLEVILIRIVPSYIINFNYYTNFILLASFLGIGVGLLLGNAQRRYEVYFPYLLLGFLTLIVFTRFGSLERNAGDIILLERVYGYYHLPSWLIVGIIFAVVTGLFVCLAQGLGKLFSLAQAKLTAYSWDLLGSIVGVTLMFLASLLQTPPVFWFASLVVMYVAFLKTNHTFRVSHVVIPLGIVLVLVYWLGNNSHWSPYYKIDLVNRSTSDSVNYELFVNDLGHQNLVMPDQKEFIYFSQYHNIVKDNIKSVLIIGAGAGNDVAIALTNGATSIDAVEIDPTITALGKQYHPAQPYSDPRVHSIIDDGRHFLNTTDKKYDLIIFALTDSLTQVSKQSALRLESYLFTEESFREAKTHLNDDGILVLYNYYWKDWLIQKIGVTLERVFNHPPYAITGENYRLASFIASTQPLAFTPEAPASEYRTSNIKPATDDWPFIYLDHPHIPNNYIWACLTVLLFSILVIGRSLGKTGLRQFSWPLFFTGAAFMLLETTAIIRFSLLFGTTWIVNSAVFIGVLAFALLANLLVQRYQPKSIWPFGILLIASLLACYVTPISSLLQLDLVPRYLLATILTLGPIFFAGTAFSTLFSKTQSANSALGSNLFGAMVGGIMEYTALMTGYSFLVLIIIGCYLAAFICYKLTKANQ